MPMARAPWASLKTCAEEVPFAFSEKLTARAAVVHANNAKTSAPKRLILPPNNNENTF